jgi:hypothetical protein
MKRSAFIGLLCFGLTCSAGERKQLPGQAGNDDVDLEASLIITHDEITTLIGNDIGEGYVFARVKIMPKGDKTLRIGPDDFTMISRKASPGTVQRDVIKGTQMDDNAKESPALAALTAKILPDKETKVPVEGFLYFSISGKLKPKDLAIIYKGEAGKLVMEFEPVKR